MKREALEENWANNIVKDPAFKGKRFNELWNVAKSKRISEDMTNRQILYWANLLLKPFGLVIRSVVKSYQLKQRFDMAGLILRENCRGRFYIDGENLLGQVLTEDCFIDDKRER